VDRAGEAAHMVRIEHFEAEAAALAYELRLLPDIESQQRALAAALLHISARVLRDASQQVEISVERAPNKDAGTASGLVDRLADRYQQESLLRIVPLSPVARR
jgi:hypothetical protein